MMKCYLELMVHFLCYTLSTTYPDTAMRPLLVLHKPPWASGESTLNSDTILGNIFRASGKECHAGVKLVH